MSRYHNSIHSPVFPSQISSYSSLSGALAPPPPQFTSPRRRRVPQSVCNASSGPICGPIGFDYIGQAGQGVSVADFSARSQNAISQMVAGANDQVLAGTGIGKINLRIMVCSIFGPSSNCELTWTCSGLDMSTWTLFRVCRRALQCLGVSSVQV